MRIRNAGREPTFKVGACTDLATGAGGTSRRSHTLQRVAPATGRLLLVREPHYGGSTVRDRRLGVTVNVICTQLVRIVSLITGACTSFLD